MMNLTPILEQEGRIYFLGIFPIPGGAKKRTALAFVVALGVMIFLTRFPPFSWIKEIETIGWPIVYALIPGVVAVIYSGAKIHGKKPEKYILTMIRYRMSPKHITPYRTLKTQTVRFGTGFTVCEGKEEEKPDASEVSHSAYRAEPGLRSG